MANRRDLRKPEDLAEFRMRACRIMLSFLGRSPAIGATRNLARPPVVDKFDGRWSLNGILIRSLKLFGTTAAGFERGDAHHVADTSGLHIDASVRHPIPCAIGHPAGANSRHPGPVCRRRNIAHGLRPPEHRRRIRGCSRQARAGAQQHRANSTAKSTGSPTSPATTRHWCRSRRRSTTSSRRSSRRRFVSTSRAGVRSGTTASASCAASAPPKPARAA